MDPEVVVAHAALETGWGRSVPMGADGKPSFNLFGIKAGSHWTGNASLASTNEFAGGRMQTTLASFRAYDSPEQSLQDYAGVPASQLRDTRER